MLILFDHGTPKGLARALSGTPSTRRSPEAGARSNNGALLNAAEEAGFELLLTTDRRIRYQQNLKARICAALEATGTAANGESEVRSAGY